MRSTWTDSRLDDLNDRFRELSERVGEQSARIDSLQHTMVTVFVATMAVMVTGFVGLAGLILAKL